MAFQLSGTSTTATLRSWLVMLRPSLEAFSCFHLVSFKSEESKRKRWQVSLQSNKMKEGLTDENTARAPTFTYQVRKLSGLKVQATSHYLWEK